MIRSAFALLMAVPAGLAAAPAMAQNDPALDDLRCLAASAQDVTDAGQDKLGALIPFFAGKLTGRDPAFNAAVASAPIKAELDQLAASDSPTTRAQIARCYAEIRAAAALLAQIPE